MKLNSILAVIVFTSFTFGCKKDPAPSPSNMLTGTYYSVDTLSVGNISMYTNSMYANTVNGYFVGPITDTQNIKSYLQRRGITDFVFGNSTQTYSNKISITFSDTSLSTIGSVIITTTNPASIIKSKRIQDYPYRYDSYSKATLLDINDLASVPVASIPTDSCYGTNTTAATIKNNYHYSITVPPTATYAFPQYVIEVKDDHLILHLVTSFMSRSEEHT